MKRIATISLAIILMLIPILGTSCGSDSNDDGAGNENIDNTTSGDFEIVEWTIVDNNSRSTLQIKFTTTKDITLYLNDPDGLEVDSDYISEGTATATELTMAGYTEVPKAGEYTLIVKDNRDETVSTSSFDFQGADAAISELATTWKYYSYSDDYNLDTLSFKITNSGDLPVYISKGSITVESKQDDFYVSDSCVLPKENKTFSPSAWVNEVTPGEKSFTLELKDGANIIVCSYSSTVTPAE